MVIPPSLKTQLSLRFFRLPSCFQFPKYIFVTRTHTLSTPANGNEIAHPGKTCNEENANETKSNEGKSDEDWDN
jgi:hypothetical protein